MVELLLHLAIPLLIATMYGLRTRWSALAGGFGLLPDLDALLGVHRSGTHSLIVVLMLYVALLGLRKSRLATMAWVFLLGAGTHLLLDAFDGYVPLLWPLYSEEIAFTLELSVTVGSPLLLSLDANVSTRPIQFTSLVKGEVFTSEGLIVGLLILGSSYLLSFLRLRAKSPAG